MGTYRKKSVVVEARQFKGGKGHKALLAWVNEVPTMRGSAFVVTDGGRVVEMVIPTMEGPRRADIGDWIIKGAGGEFYPCKPDVFEFLYERAEDDQ